MSPRKENRVLLLLNFLNFLVHKLNKINLSYIINQYKSCYNEFICVSVYIYIHICVFMFMFGFIYTYRYSYRYLRYMIVPKSCKEILTYNSKIMKIENNLLFFNLSCIKHKSFTFSILDAFWSN